MGVPVTIALLLAFCLLASPATSQTCVQPTAAEHAEAAAAATPQEAVIAAALLPAQTGLPASLTRADLPKTRPSQPWPYRTLSSALSASEPTTDPTTGITRFSVQHAPLAKVTAKQLQWWFEQDLEKVTRYTGDGKKYSLYLQWHPRDHCHSFTTAVGPPANTTQGDSVLLQDIVNASRPFTRSSFAGFDAPTEAQINLNMTISVNSTGMQLQFKIAGIAATSVTHTWTNSKAGALVTSSFQIGSQGVGSAVNKIINCAFSRGAEPLDVARKVQLHNVEEFGNFERILPGLYARRNTL